MAEEATKTEEVTEALQTSSESGEQNNDQIEQLKGYLKTIMAKQEELKKLIEVKHNKAESARKLSNESLREGSLRNLMVERDDEKHTVELMQTPGMAKRLQDYSHDVDELEKEYEETSKLVNEVASALALMNG
jgi:hypothetical protein